MNFPEEPKAPLQHRFLVIMGLSLFCWLCILGLARCIGSALH